MKRKDGVGATPKGSVADSWRAPDAILDGEALESGFRGPLESASNLESVRAVQEARWSRRRSKGSASPIATKRQLEGARRHS